MPVYIQEQISPKALIEDLRATSASGREAQLDLFSDFNGLPFEERVEFYQHPMHWTNRMILGDSLTVMTSLAEKEGLKGQVQMIYVDPPYGIKFGSNWQVSTRKRDVKDGKVEDATRQPEQIRAFRDTWELGIHSYLSYLRDRFTVARDLLTESGSIFVQIGDENLHLVRSVLDEVFGADNFVSPGHLQEDRERHRGVPRAVSGLRALVREVDGVRQVPTALPARQVARREPTVRSGHRWHRRRMTADEIARADAGDPAGSGRFCYRSRARHRAPEGRGRSVVVPVAIGGREYRPAGGRWKTNASGHGANLISSRIASCRSATRSTTSVTSMTFRLSVTNLWETRHSGFGEEKVYVVQTGTKVIERCMLMATDPGDLVLDPTCGSGTTAYVAEQWGRRWITVDTSRVALALARTRLMSARYPYYLMADTPEGQRKEAELSGQPAFVGTQGDIRKGFVYERVPHVTLKSIAQNPDIREGMTREEIDRAIARHAETELLYDRPYEDKKVVRVAGPFTVESLSPHRVVADGPEDHASEPDVPVEESGRFVTMILDNLRKAGVQNTVKGERLEFTTLDPFPGRWLHAKGEYLENEQPKRVAVAIGPEFGTVGPELVREAAKEAVGYFDLLVICGFAFDAMTEEERVKTSRLGSLTILQARMNPDLLMGDALKKTGAGNLFTVFGQPDIDVRTAADGRLQVEIRGVDIFDPNTGQIRSSGPDDIACWFIDTDYNGEAFFVRHAYFLGGDQPYDKLARALKAEVDPDAWESLYSAVSRPFPKPRSGRIAIKVINHFGDEVVKVSAV